MRNAQAPLNNREGEDAIAIDDVKHDHTGGAGPPDDERIISPHGNGMYAKKVDAHGEENRRCEVCESAADVGGTFLTQVEFSEGELGESWAEIPCYVHARLHTTSSSTPRTERY